MDEVFGTHTNWRHTQARLADTEQRMVTGTCTLASAPGACAPPGGKRGAELVVGPVMPAAVSRCQARVSSLRAPHERTTLTPAVWSAWARPGRW